MTPATRVIAVCVCLWFPSLAWACLWDSDTLHMERVRFPSALELITGKFLRHSREFYQWRTEDRLKRLKDDPENAALLDDLAVAYDKTGQHEKAIETALRTEQFHSGRYETAANLGTFYIHAGQLEAGLPEVERAIQINPAAHFGREKYQKLLVEYVLERRKAGASKPPLSNVTIHSRSSSESPTAPAVSVDKTFAEFLRKGASDENLRAEERNAATKGLLGMMRFGKHDSPILLEALASVLVDQGWDPQSDGKLLATRALLMASYQVPKGPSQTAYRGMAALALRMQTPGKGTDEISLEEVEAVFKKELEDADQWYETVRKRELAWIRDGLDPEQEFNKLYETEPVVREVPPQPAAGSISRDDLRVLVTIALALATPLVLFVGVVGVVRWRRRASAPGPAA